MKIPDFVKALLLSRKFWVAVIGVVMGSVLYAQGAITGEQLADLIVILMGILISAIAGEDIAKKLKS